MGEVSNDVNVYILIERLYTQECLTDLLFQNCLKFCSKPKFIFL